MIRFFQFLAIVSVAALIYIAHAQKVDRDARALRVEELAACFKKEDFHRHAPSGAAGKAFLRAVYLLYKNVEDEPPPKVWQEFRADLHWYLDEALKEFPAPDNELNLLKSSLVTAHGDASRMGLFTDPDGRGALASGDLPIIASGLFAGERLRVGWRLSPVLIPEATNHMANFVLQPAIAWGLQHDRLDDVSFDTAKRFRAAGLLNEESFALAESYHLAARAKK